MDLDKTVLMILLVNFIKESGAEGHISTHFATRVPTINNYGIQNGSLAESYVRRVTECANQCGLDGHCRSFFYTDDSRLCQLQDVIFTNLGPMSYSYRTRYYKMNEVVSNFTCSLAPPDSSYNSALLPDNTVFTYRLVWSLVEKATAESNCAYDGAGLVQVVTEAKMTTLQTIFSSCQGYVGAGDYWIDGSNINAEDFFNITEWETSSGEPLPINQFWAPGEPAYPYKDHCIALWAASGYKWASLKCSYTNYYICEK